MGTEGGYSVHGDGQGSPVQTSSTNATVFGWLTDVSQL